MRPDGKPGFRTPSGKLELYSQFYEKLGLDPLPYFDEPIESPVRTPEVWKEYPLILITGRRSSAFFHSEHRQIPWLRELVPNPTVEIHPDTAKKFGITEGSWVWIEGRQGRAKRIAHITPIMHPKMVHAMHAWWYPEDIKKPPYTAGMWDININQLLPAQCQSKSGFGGAQFKTILCKIYPVNP